MRLILASNSSIRKALFDMIGWKYEIIPSNIEENSSSTSPDQYVIDLSKDKADSVVSQINDNALIIATDTIIYMNNEKFEKPKSKEQAFEFIKKMSGQVTYAVTGVTIKDLYQNKEISFSDTTEVHIKNLSDDDILWYVENEKDILNRSGYCIAGKASLFVDKVVGDFYNVLGIPIGKLHSTLNELGYSLSDFDLNK